MKRSLPIYPLLFLIGITSLCIYIWLTTKPTDDALKEPQSKFFKVQTVHPIIKPMPIYIEEIAKASANETVSIIPQVSGLLKAIHFTEGQNVTAGQLLFEIEDAPYRASLDQAKANYQRDAAQSALLKSNVDRYKALVELEYVTRQQYEEAQAAFDAQQGLLAADAAQVKQAEIQLSYTQIHAPISGKIGTLTVHPGELISANSGSALTVINRMDPIVVNFAVSQNHLPALMQNLKNGQLSVDIMKDNNRKIASGRLTTINNNVDPQTGTLALKAIIPNPDLKLWPGQLVTTRLILAVQPQAIVIPATAVQSGQQGKYVFLVKKGKAIIQAIESNQQVDHEIIVQNGLHADDELITEVPPRLSEGDFVQNDATKTS